MITGRVDFMVQAIADEEIEWSEIEELSKEMIVGILKSVVNDMKVWEHMFSNSLQSLTKGDDTAFVELLELVYPQQIQDA